MPKRQFHFSPSVQLILTNLPTIRRIQKVLDSGTFKLEVKQFLKHLEIRLAEDIPDIKTWQTEIVNDTLYLCPGQSWHVVKDDYIAVCICMDQCLQPLSYNDEDDPFVGLYVPVHWKHWRSFTNRLKTFRTLGFDHIDEHEDYEGLHPIWSYVHIATFAKQRTLELDGLEKAIIDLARRLVAREGKIRKVISEVRRRRA